MLITDLNWQSNEIAKQKADGEQGSPNATG